MPHYVGSWLGVAPARGRTACGLDVWKTKIDGEADTRLCNRVEYAEAWPMVTCQKCLRSVERRQLMRRPGSIQLKV